MTQSEKKPTKPKPEAPTRQKKVTPADDMQVLIGKAILASPFLLFSCWMTAHQQQQMGWLGFGAAAFIGAPGFLGNQIKSMAQGALKGLLAEEQERERERGILPPGVKDEDEA